MSNKQKLKPANFMEEINFDGCVQKTQNFCNQRKEELINDKF